MAEAVPGSGNAPVEVHFDLAAAPTAGRPFTLQLAVVAKAPAPVVRLDAVTDGGITVLQPTLPVTLEKVEQGVPGLTTLTIRGDAAGVALLRVSVTLESPTGNESKSFMVPVIIGERRD
jgi:hypothetical protein